MKTETEKSEEPKTAAENVNSEPETAEKTESVVSDNTEIKEVSATEENVSQPAVIAEESTPETEESESETESAEPDIEKTKTITLNGKTYTADFVKTEENCRSIIGYDRKTNIYETEDELLQLEYDFITDDLLSVIILETEETDKKITKDEAKEIADNFINQHADISGYTFKEVSENDYEKNYCVTYSKYIDGYYSAQMVTAYITFDGNIKKYYNEDLIFEGIDTNIKIKIEKLDKKLDKELKKVYGKDVKYTASTIIINLEENKDLVMRYSVELQKKDEETGETVVEGVFASVGIKNNDVRLSTVEAM